MLFKNLNGRDVNLSTKQYLIDWDHVVSGPQKAVKDFLRPYWEPTKMVLEEARIPSTLLRLDLFNISDMIVVEIDGTQHDDFNEFMHGSLAGYRAMMKRDLDKLKWAELNGLTSIVIKQKEIPLLSAEWMKKTFGLVL